MATQSSHAAGLNYAKTKLLIIDLDNTLCDTHRSLSKRQWTIVAQDLRAQGLKHHAALLLNNFGKQGFAATIRSMHLTPTQRTRAIVRFSRMDVSKLTLYPDAEALLALPITKVLVSRGQKLLQYRKLRHLGIDKSFSKIYIVPTFRTKRDAIRRALEDFHTTPSTALIIGDRNEEEIADANALGIPAVLVKRAGWPVHNVAKPTVSTKDLRTVARAFRRSITALNR